MGTKIFDYGIDQASAALAKHHDKKFHEIALLNYYKGVYVAADAIKTGQATAEELQEQVTAKAVAIVEAPHD